MPVRGKELLTFHCGFRRFDGRPIFSQLGAGSNTKVQFPLSCGTTRVMSALGGEVFAKATGSIFDGECVRTHFIPAGPSPVVPKGATCFASKSTARSSAEASQLPGAANPLVAWGSLIDVNPNRVLVKRIILSGHPLSCHRSSAVVRCGRWSRLSCHCIQVHVLRPRRRAVVPAGRTVDETWSCRPHPRAPRHQGLHEVHIQRANQTTRHSVHEPLQASISSSGF